MSVRVVTSTSAAARLEAAAAFLTKRSPSAEMLIVGASRGAADDLARSVADRTGATFGISRFSLTELAARLAAVSLAGTHRVRGTQAGAEAVAARVTFDACQADELGYFTPVAASPGFPRALARTLHELRLAGLTSDGVGGVSDTPPTPSPRLDLAHLLARLEKEQEKWAIDDRRALFVLAAESCGGRRGVRHPSDPRWVGVPVVVLDVTVDSRSERDFVRALTTHAREAIVTFAAGDERAREAFAELGPIEDLPDPAATSSDLLHLRRYIFTEEQPPLRKPTRDVQLFSAPGEGREAVEILRRVLDEAKRGVPFDDMAIFLRTPQHYQGLLEHACARAGVPVYFDRGTRRPDPSGRAFIALLSSAVDGLSAKRFDEYLSLGQVPRLDRTRAVAPAIPRDESFGELSPDVEANEPDAVQPDAPQSDSDDDAIVAGTLRSPWRWEELIVESAVVGGRTRSDGRARWRRRLEGLAADYRYRMTELAREEPESPRIRRFERDLKNLEHLKQFALPIIDMLAGWPDRASWGAWLELLTSLAVQALDRPDRVVQTLADLRPMSDIGPVSLEEVRDVLRDRLLTLDWDPPPRRYGRLFVGTPHQARGRTFRVVFVPGLAERVVPQRPREDPLLLDEWRRQIDRALLRRDGRVSAERLLLRIAIGAASEKLYLSYPRMDVAETRARVPSFYALDVMRAITGRVPDHRELARDAEEEAGAMLAWPAPKNPDTAIDDLEHDLAVLRGLLDSTDRRATKGRAHYLLGLNESLKRSMTSQWLRGRKKWSTSDGLVRVTPSTRQSLAAQRLGARAYSLSALQRFATCPYQFLLSTIHRLEPWDEPQPLMRMNPLTRGSLFHRIQSEFLAELRTAGALPIGAASLAQAAQVLNRVTDRVADEYAERLAPAIERVWADEIGDLKRDLSIWMRKLADGTGWIPEYFEFSFGLHDEGRDPRSVGDAVTVDGRFLLHGSVDLIERAVGRDVLRVTDHKTGKNRTSAGLVVGGGRTLQPVLYSVVVEEVFKKKVESGRLYFCTTAGGFSEVSIPIDGRARSEGLQVLTIIDRAIEQGSLVPAPVERACTWCDFRPVCGPGEERRVAEKDQEPLADLEALRLMK